MLFEMNEAKSETQMAQVEMQDDCIWTKLISDKALAKKLDALPDDEIVLLETDGNIHCWAKMKTGKDGRPTPGLRPANDEANAYWQSFDPKGEGKGKSFALQLISTEELVARLRTTDEEIAKLQDDMLRARAEMENIRKRAQNEVIAARKYAIEGFAKELLTVRDSLERAGDAGDTLADTMDLDAAAGESLRNMREGLALTLKQLDLTAGKFGVGEVDAAPGGKFDPQRHQAISTVKTDEIDLDCIVEVVQKGFILKERLLRPAMVVVAEKS